MATLSRGPRSYKIFICHRYGDDHLYGTLRQQLNEAKRFRWRNLSIQTDDPLSPRTDQGLKAAITRKIKKADILLVFAHSSGKWINHEIATANRWGIPIVGIVDPARLEEPNRRARMSQIADVAIAEVNLDAADKIVQAIRANARQQRSPKSISVSGPQLDESIDKPADIASRLSERSGQKGFISRLSDYLLGRNLGEKSGDRSS